MNWLISKFHVIIAKFICLFSKRSANRYLTDKMIKETLKINR